MCSEAFDWCKGGFEQVFFFTLSDAANSQGNLESPRE